MFDVNVDPLGDVRLAHRWAVAGIGAVVAVLLPAYALLLGVGVDEAVFVIAPLVIAAFLGIELGTRWEYRMRRRYAYPHRLGYEMAAVHDFRAAGERAAKLIAEWFDARAVVVSWLSEDGRELEPIAGVGLAPAWIMPGETAPADSTPLNVLAGGDGSSRANGRTQAAFVNGLPAGKTSVIPLLNREHQKGAVTLVTAHGNQLVRDERLLAALGMVTCLALDNARLYEGQRAHAEHLQELNRMKSDFLTNVSHELRTPLTSIMMAAEMLVEEEEARDASGTLSRLAQNIVKGASRLSALVSDLVSISREDRYRPRLEMELLPAADVVANAVSIIQPLLFAKQQTIEIEMDGEAPLVRVDRLRFDQVLINLLSNAQKHSPPTGHIRLLVASSGQEVVFRITDSGPGVSEDDRAHVFEPFYRSGSSGLGLGLAIAKSLVELHNGRIWVESNRKGSSFCVALPAYITKRSVRSPAGSAAAG